MQRVNYIINLRAFCVLLVFALHVCLPFSSFGMELFYYIPNPFQLKMNFVVFALNNISMPLFFIIAGYLAYHSLSNRSIADFVFSRLYRLGLPLLVGLIIITPGHLLIYFEHLIFDPNTVLNFNNFYKIFLCLDYLWFIYFLILYSLILAFFVKMKTFILPFIREKINLNSPILFIIILLTLAIALGNKPYVELSSLLLPSAQAFLSYGLFFILGIVINAKSSFLVKLKYPMAWYLSSGLVALIIAFVISTQVTYTTTNFILGCLSSAYATINISLGIFLLFYFYVNKVSILGEKLAGISYWLYLTQLPLLEVVNFFLRYNGYPLSSQLILSACLAFTLCCLLYKLCMKATVLNQFFNKGCYQ